MSTAPFEPSDQAWAELERRYPHVQHFQAAELLWNRVLDDADREKLGNSLPHAYQNGRTVGMWMRLRNVSEPRAVIELAHGLGFLSETDRRWLVREIGENDAPAAEIGEKDASPAASKPQWNREMHELWFQGKLARRVSRPKIATNVIAILNNFEDAGWPLRLDDPLPGGRDQLRLHQAIKSLNNGLQGLHFSADGSGQGIRWERWSTI